MPKSHSWNSNGSRRAIWWHHEPPEEIMQYLQDKRDAINHAFLAAGIEIAYVPDETLHGIA